MELDKLDSKFILIDYKDIIDKIYKNNQYNNILINTDQFNFIDRLINDFNKHKIKKYIIGKEYIFGQPKSKYLEKLFKVVFLGCISLNKKEFKNKQEQHIMICGITLFNNEALINSTQEENLIYYFATKNDYVSLTKSECKKVIFSI